MKKSKIIFSSIIAILGITLFSCSSKKEEVLIYTSLEDYRVEYLNKRLVEQFPDYNVIVEYMSTGNHAAKLMAEGTDTDCDITYDLEYGYLQKLDDNNVLADLSSYDKSIYVPDTIISDNFLPEVRNGGAIVYNPELLKEKNIPVPTCYEDLLNPALVGLVSMPSPKASGTGYMFYKSLVNSLGEKAALEYFDKLTPNILQYTSSGSGPINALLQKEVAIGLGMTAQAVTKINEGANLKITFFDEGSPYSLYGTAIIKGKESKPAVKEVFDWIVSTFNYENCENFYPEKIYKDKDFETPNYPQNIKYADMSNNSADEKERLLDLWKY